MNEIESKPIISVIMPTYNRAHLVARAIKSLQDQTYQNFKLIIIVDCSIDNSEEVIRSFNDERIRYIAIKK